MSSAGRAVSSNGCVTKPKGRETGLQSCVRETRSSSLTGSYVMETAEQREPYESRGSRTVLGEPGGESPPGHSTVGDEPRRAVTCGRSPQGAPRVRGADVGDQEFEEAHPLIGAMTSQDHGLSDSP